VRTANPFAILEHFDAVGGDGAQLPPQALQLCAEDAARAGDELGGIDEVGVPARMNANRGAKFSRPSPCGARVIQMDVREEDA